jgi:hypothetical protein
MNKCGSVPTRRGCEGVGYEVELSWVETSSNKQFEDPRLLRGKEWHGERRLEAQADGPSYAGRLSSPG